MKAIISALLGYDPKQLDTQGGILGVVNAYYGCVEAQGRGSLHCHMLIWVEGGLNPNEIKAKVLANGGDADFQRRLMLFLEDTISTDFPPASAIDVDSPLSNVNPCKTRGPGMEGSSDALIASRQKDLHDLVEACQVHDHHPTCYKYWKGPGFEKECRFNLDESNFNPISQFDPETGEFTLQCMHGMVNRFNRTILTSIRCNMDIQFVSSGPAAKAVMHYITDYITKTSLQAHVAYAVLEMAVTRLSQYEPDGDDYEMRARRLLQRCAHALISQQELSGQQVASYLMDFEDHFTSHVYSNIYWTSLEHFIDLERPSPKCYPSVAKSVDDVRSSEVDPPTREPVDSIDEVLPTVEHRLEDYDESARPDLVDDVTLCMNKVGKFVATANQVADYQCHGDALLDLNVWDFVARVDKVKIAKAAPVDADATDDNDDGDREIMVDEEGGDCATEKDHQSSWDPSECDILDWMGRTRPRVAFLEEHLEVTTHILQVCQPSDRRVPVPIGPGLPRRDRDDMKSKHARLMLILFKP
ncbi:hypothetical protein C8J57DRAFT_1096161 [Mycena rebaudengoi]|nr:hypothetical protein C8J57DRAFT_1096161 [Mycena rebaudengoi]